MTGICLLLLAVLPGICEGRVFLTGSSTTAVAGQPFTFTCNSVYGGFFTIWTVQLPNETSSFEVRSYIDDECRHSFNPTHIYSFTCPRDGQFTMTILDVDYSTHQNSNWTCLVVPPGRRSNMVVLDVNDRSVSFKTWTANSPTYKGSKCNVSFLCSSKVPLKTINLLTSTTHVLNLTEGDTVLLVCETNPTKPPSNITWMKDDDIITTGTSSSTREDGGLTVTIGRLSMEVTREFHMKRIDCVGSYEGTNLRTNSTLLHIDVPLVEISIINSTNLPLAMTENDDVTLVCETNPTQPLSTIIWTKGNQTLTEDVTSSSRAIDGAVVAVSMATFTVSCDHHLSRIQCSGFYKSTRIASKSQTLFVHCIEKEDISGPTFSAGVGVGVTICLVPLLVAAAVCIVWWKRRHTTTEKSKAPESTENTTPTQSDDGHPPNLYESMDESTRERKETTYEELAMQVYENTG